MPDNERFNVVLFGGTCIRDPLKYVYFIISYLICAFLHLNLKLIKAGHTVDKYSMNCTIHLSVPLKTVRLIFLLVVKILIIKYNNFHKSVDCAPCM